MSNPNDQMAKALVGFLNTIFGDAKPKADATDTSQKSVDAPKDAKAAADDDCNCLACQLRRLLEGKQRTAITEYDLHLEGCFPKEIGIRVGGLSESAKEDDKTQSLRIATAILIACAEDTATNTPAQEDLQAQAIEHFEKGIKALNELLASTTSESGATT